MHTLNLLFNLYPIARFEQAQIGMIKQLVAYCLQSQERATWSIQGNQRIILFYFYLLNYWLINDIQQQLLLHRLIQCICALDRDAEVIHDVIVDAIEKEKRRRTTNLYLFLIILHTHMACKFLHNLILFDN